MLALKAANRRLLLVLAVAGVVVLAVVIYAGVTLLHSDSADLAAAAPPLPSTPAGGKPAAVPASGFFHYVVDQGSKAKFVAREQLAVMPTPNNAVGETATITGDLFFMPSGNVAAQQKSTFKVDLRTLRTDEALRDRAMQGSLGVDKFPFAEYTITGVEGFPANYSDGKEVPVTLRGQLTVRDQTKPVSWSAFVRKAGDYVSAVADADIRMTDFGIQPPVASITRVEDPLHLQITVVGKLAQ